jgi:hypothetical protein
MPGGNSAKGVDRGALLARARKRVARCYRGRFDLCIALEEQEVVLRFRGLPFARWKDGQICFWSGSGSAWRELLPRNQAQLKRVVHSLETSRSPLGNNPRHPLYRAHVERWMQSLVVQDITKVDFLLDAENVYEQVIANYAGHHGILDLLTVTRAKRLEILELKASENLELPLQAADYWKRIRRHQVQGDLARYGYFPGLELQTAPPILYLVAPALRFHPTTHAILKYLSPEMEVVRVGLAENWRRGLRVVMRPVKLPLKRYLPGQLAFFRIPGRILLNQWLW